MRTFLFVLFAGVLCCSEYRAFPPPLDAGIGISDPVGDDEDVGTIESAHDDVLDVGTSDDEPAVRPTSIGIADFVKTSSDTAVVDWGVTRLWSIPPIAMGAFLRPNQGMFYALLVFERRAGESLLEWDRRTWNGDAFLPERTVQTMNGHVGFVYETNDLGAVPSIHIVVPTERFVYRFEWRDPRLPDGMEQIMELMREQGVDYFMTVPEDFLRFVQDISVL